MRSPDTAGRADIVGTYTRVHQMEAWIGDFSIQCRSCTAVIALSVVVVNLDPKTARRSLNELLVDYGWLPTSDGSYCREHAAPARQQQRRDS
jgi:hypothetical protein